MRKYLGLEISHQNGTFYVSQEGYIRKILDEFNLMNLAPAPTPMVDSEKWDREDSPLLSDPEKERYQSAIGMLLYLMHGTRPDLSYPVIKLSQYSSRPRKLHWDGIKRIFRYLKGTLHHALALGSLPSTSEKLTPPGLVAYFDSAHADNSNQRSTCGYVSGARQCLTKGL